MTMTMKEFNHQRLIRHQRSKRMTTLLSYIATTAAMLYGSTLTSTMTTVVVAFHTSTRQSNNYQYRYRPFTSSTIHIPLPRSTIYTTSLFATSKKGFGKSTTNTTPSSSSSKSELDPSTANTSIDNNQSKVTVEATTTTSASSTKVDSSSVSSTASSSSMNSGQRALQELRRQNIEQKDQELRQVRELIQADTQVQTAGPVAIPEQVAQRMGLRMLPFVGIPFFGGMMTFILFWYYATYQNVQFEPTLVAASTILLLLVGLVVRFYITLLFPAATLYTMCNYLRRTIY
jgi:Photosynthesis affected mutant 68